MKVVRRSDRVAVASAAWREQFFTRQGSRWYDDNKQNIFEKLEALKPPTRDQVNAIIGNDSWTAIRCDECEEDVERGVQMKIGEYDDDPPRSYCLRCLKKAAQILEHAHG